MTQAQELEQRQALIASILETPSGQKLDDAAIEKLANASLPELQAMHTAYLYASASTHLNAAEGRIKSGGGRSNR